MTTRRGILIAALAGFAAPLPAQAPTQAPFTSVALVTVKPDRVAEWLEVERQYSEAFKKGGGHLRSVYRNSAGNPYEFKVVSTLENYARLDEESPYSKGAGEAGLARLAARRSQCVESVRTSYQRALPELRIAPPPGPPSKLQRSTRVTVRNGMANEYLAIMKNEYVPALKKAGVASYSVRRVEWGGSRNLFITNSRLDKFAQLDEGGILTKSMGAEAANKLIAKLQQVIVNTEYILYTYVPESSLYPSPQ